MITKEQFAANITPIIKEANQIADDRKRVQLRGDQLYLEDRLRDIPSLIKTAIGEGKNWVNGFICCDRHKDIGGNLTGTAKDFWDYCIAARLCVVLARSDTGSWFIRVTFPF